jgi:hypothetical protein
MSPIASTTAMKIKPKDVWSEPFPFSSYDFSTIKHDGVENNLNIGTVVKVFPRARNSSRGPYVVAEFWINDKKCLLLICCSSKSDFGYKTALSLEGVQVRPRQRPGMVDKFYVCSFDDVINAEVRNHLRDIESGKKEFVPAGTTATGPINNVEDSAEEDIPAGTTATGPINNVEDSAEEDIPAGTTATGPINNVENFGEVEVHKVTNTSAHEIKPDSESEYIEIKISIRKR